MEYIKIVQTFLYGFTSGYLFKITKLNFKCKGLSVRTRPFHSSYQLFFNIIQSCNDLKTGLKVFLKSLFCPNRFTFPVWIYFSVINGPGDVIIMLSDFAKIFD